MLLTIDIGNSNITFGLFEGQKLVEIWRLPSITTKSADDYAIDIVELFLSAKINIEELSGCVLASVVPTLTESLKQAISRFFAGKTLVIGENVDLNIEINIEKPKEVGADRLINAIAGFKKFGGNLIIVDFGTATTFDIVGEFGQYLGGIIAPGLNLSLKALHEMTAKLPKIEVAPQKNVIGKNTVEAMNSGVFHGYSCLINGLIAKIEDEIGLKTTKILTGGLAETFKNEIPNSHHEPNLTLDGLCFVYNKNN